jgi:hypothetical protein
LRPALLFFALGGVNTAASISARKLANASRHVRTLVREEELR